MRKKYLSALLFGALVMASTATFTSCKDYDDDIDNLQEQINSNASAIKALQDKVNAGKWITDLSSVAGGFKVTFSDGQSFTIVNGKDGVNGADGAAGEAGVAGADGTKVTIGEDGYWYLDGEKTEYKATAQTKAPFLGEDGFLYFYKEGSEEPVKSDIYNSTGVYAVVVGNVISLYTFDENGKPVKIVAPTAENTLTNVATVNNTWNVAWGVAAADVEFNGTTFKAGDLLLGGINTTTTVTVTPRTYDLGAQELGLVDINGKAAPVKVTASVPQTVGFAPRMESASGEWDITIALDETVDKSNIATAFTGTQNGILKNMKYALTVNGQRMSNYTFVIDTQTELESQNNTAADKGKLANPQTIELDGAEIQLDGADGGKVVASYITFEGVNLAISQAKNIKAEGMTVTAPASAAGTNITATINYLDVTGAVDKGTVALLIAPTQSVETVEVAPVNYSISTDNVIKVDMGTVLSTLDANIVVNASDVEVLTDEGTFFALSSTKAEDGFYPVAKTANIKFFNAKDEAVVLKGDLRSIVKAEITLANDGTTAADAKSYKTKATKTDDLKGTKQLKLNFKQGNNVLHSVVIPVNVSLPTFDSFYKKNAYAGWDGNNLNWAITENTDKPQINFAATNIDNAFTDLKDKKLTAGTFVAYEPANSAEVTYTYYDATAEKNQTGKADLADLADLTTMTGVTNLFKGYGLDGVETIATTNARMLNATSFNVNFQTTAGKVFVKLAGDADNAATGLTVSSSLTLKAQPIFSGAKLVYFKNDVALEVAEVAADGSIEPFFYKVETDGADKVTSCVKEGLALVLGDEIVPIGKSTNKTEFKIGESYAAAEGNNKAFDGTLKGLTLNNCAGFGYDAAIPTSGNINIYWGKTPQSMGTPAVPVTTAWKTSVAGLTEGQGGELILYFVDETGLTTTASIQYKK